MLQGQGGTGLWVLWMGVRWVVGDGLPGAEGVGCSDGVWNAMISWG